MIEISDEEKQSIDEQIETQKKYIEELKQLSKDIIYNYC